MHHRDFTYPGGSRDFYPSPLYTAPSSPPFPSSVSQPSTPLPSGPHPAHTYANFVSLASPTRTARVNGLAPVALASSASTTAFSPPASPHSPRLPFAAIAEPHDPLLVQLNGRVMEALSPISQLHQHLQATTSTLSAYLHSSTALFSSLSSLAPTTTLTHYTAFHASLFSSSQSCNPFLSLEVLYPVSDWLDDADQCTIELGHTQTTRHQLDRAQDELQALFEMKLADAVPPSIDELIEGSKEGLERLSALYSGQVEGVQKSVRRVLDSRARVLEVVARNVMEWEWRVMKRWKGITDLQSRKADQPAEDEEEKEDAEDGQEDDEQPLPPPPHDEPSRIGPSRKYSHSDEVVKGGVDDDEEDDGVEPTSPSTSRESAESDESDGSRPVSPSSAGEGAGVAPEVEMATKLALPYKAPYPATRRRLEPLPFPALPLTSALSSSVWLAMFSSAYRWDEARDELVCEYEVRQGAGKEEVVKAFKRRKNRKGATPPEVPTQKLRLLSDPREAEVEHVTQRLQMTAEDVVDAVRNVDMDRLTAEKVQYLVDVLPSEEETERLQAALAQPQSAKVLVTLPVLSPASSLLGLLVAPVHPSFVTRLRCLHFHYQLPVLSASLMDSIALLQSACVEVRDSKQLQHVLAVILEVFNFLHPQHVAYGFDLTVLASLASLSAPSSPSFLTFLVSHLAKHFPQLLSFPSSLPSLHRASQVLPSSLAAQHTSIQQSLSLFRQMLDDLDASSDSRDRSSRLGWLIFYERAVETMEKVEKRMMGLVAKADGVCRWLCWNGRRVELKEEEEKEVEAGRRLTGCDVYSLLRALEDFVADFLRAARKEEKRRRRREDFKVDLKAEKLKVALAEQVRRQKESDRTQAALPSPSPPMTLIAVKEYTEPVHPAVFSPHFISPPAAVFSDLHERHSPPMESMQRNPSIIAAPPVRDAAAAAPPTLSQVFRDTRNTSSGSSSGSPMMRSPVFSVSPSGAKASSPAHQRAGSETMPRSDSSPAYPRTGSFTATSPPAAGSGGLTPVEFVQEVLEADAATRRASGVGKADGLVESGMYVRNESHDVHIPTALPVNVVRRPYSSHFTYQP